MNRVMSKSEWIVTSGGGGRYPIWAYKVWCLHLKLQLTTPSSSKIVQYGPLLISKCWNINCLDPKMSKYLARKGAKYIFTSYISFNLISGRFLRGLRKDFLSASNKHFCIVKLKFFQELTSFFLKLRSLFFTVNSKSIGKVKIRKKSVHNRFKCIF